LPSIAAINEFVFVASATVRAADEQHVDTPLSARLAWVVRHAH
jgi:hypothetical protein